MKIGITKIFNDLPEWLRNDVLGNGSEGLGNDSEGFEKIRNGLLKYEIEIGSMKEEEGSKKKEKGKPKFTPPSLDEFIQYAKENKSDVDTESVKFKYLSWESNEWHDGNGNKIKNWKSKLLNTLPFLKESKLIKGKDISEEERSKIINDITQKPAKNE